MRQGLKKIAAYRDEDGKLFLRSAACTHLGCHVHWNSLERCWDCHGSHFAVDDAVLGALRATRPALPVILVTGYGNLDALKDFGDGRILQKPYGDGDLLAR